MAVTASGTLGMHLIIPALPAAAATELQVSPATIQLTITLYLLGLAIRQLLYGPLADRLGRRPVLLGGLSLFTLAEVATSLAPSATSLIVARVLQSIGGLRAASCWAAPSSATPRPPTEPRPASRC